MHFLSSDDLSKEGINKIFEIADSIKDGSEEMALRAHSTLVLYFEKPSTRTRLSFEGAISQLGGNAVYLDPNTTQRSRGETLADTARMLSSYCDFIAARLYKHSDLIEIANNSSVPVINALTDLEHPTQALADLYTIRQYKKNVRDVNIAFVGDIASNTANSLMLTASKLSADVTLVGPKGYPYNTKIVNKAKEYSKIVVTDSMEEGLEDADIIYTDTFVSMGQEADSEKRKKMFAPYQINKKALGFAKTDTLVMHCLPAHREEEITSEVLDSKSCIAWQQAKNKLLLNKALLIYLSESTPSRPQYTVME
ncbi:MAG: ornithine carbamoyltransferase [Candidatus Micrarchaeales archaeon]